jgi:SET and MYND domain-containing protein 4
MKMVLSIFFQSLLYSISVMFCSDCREIALKIHRYECSIMSQLKSGSVHIALRIFFISLSVFDGDIEKLQDFVNEIDRTASTVYDFDFTDTNSCGNVKNYLRCLNSLSRSSKNFSLEFHAEVMRNHPMLKDLWAEHENFIRKFLQRQCQTNDLYFHGIFGGSLRKEDTVNTKSLQMSIGSGWFPFCSLINHSCAPNVMRIYVEGKVALVACRPISAGQQLFDCYK